MTITWKINGHVERYSSNNELVFAAFRLLKAGFVIGVDFVIDNGHLK